MNYYLSSPSSLDLLFKDLFDTSSYFSSLPSIKKIDYPVNIRETNEGLEIELAAINLNKEDIKIDISDQTLQISYDKPIDKKPLTVEAMKVNSAIERSYIYRGITQKSFSHAWKISDKFDITKTDASLDKGLLKVTIPVAPEKQPKQIEVKIK